MPAFDPYHKWLSIPPAEQPPNHYRLLGVPLFESDLDVIEAAAERQTVFLRTLQIGPQAELAERILNEISSAQVTLLNVDRKLTYDAALRQQRTETEQQAQTAEPHSRESAVVTPVHKDEQSDTTESVEPLVNDDFRLDQPTENSFQFKPALTSSRYRHKPRKATRWLTLSVLAGICIAIILLWTFWGGVPSENSDHQPIVQQDSEDTPIDEEPADEEPVDEEPADEEPVDEEFGGDPPGPFSTPSEDTLVSRLPVSDEDAREEAQALLDDLFGRDYDEAAKLPETQRYDALKELAAEIYSLCPDEDDSEIRYVLLDMAVRISTESGDPDLTTEIIDDLAAQFDVDDRPLRVTAVNLWGKQAMKNYRGKELLRIRLIFLDLILPLAERAESEDRYGMAAELYDLASKNANRERQIDLRKRGLALHNKGEVHDGMMKLEKELESPGEDLSIEEIAEKHLTLGAYWCFELDDWQQGLVHLAASNSEELSEIAQLDLDSQTNPEDAESVGDRWWDLKPTPRFSKYKDQLKARAAYWYALAIDDKTGLARKKLEKRIEEAGFVLGENGMVLEAAPSLPAKTPPLSVAPFKERQAKAHQKAWARNLDTRVEMSNSIGMQLRLIPPGEFLMGSLASESGRDDGETQHRVRITKPFYLSVHVVTQQQYERVVGNNPSHSKGANKPVEQVSWNDVVEFCRKLSNQEDVEYRLPTEAEWEYACRAGTTTAYSFGDDTSQLGQYAWYKDNSGNARHPVGQKLPNAWGLYDIHGNVLEWCQDWYAAYGSENVLIDPTGPASGERHVMRGGSFTRLPLSVRSANRDTSLPDDRNYNFGFRLARTCNFERTPPAKTTKRKTRLRRKSTTPPLAVTPFDERQAKAHQAAWARHLGTRLEISNSIGVKLKLVPPGEFTMGSPESESSRRGNETQHRVKITKPFYLSAHEVTQQQYLKVMGENRSNSKGANNRRGRGRKSNAPNNRRQRNNSRPQRIVDGGGSNPSDSKGENKPVEMVSWDDAVEFCNRLSKSEGVEYRLPTEAEWEYACRAGTTTAYSFGDDASKLGQYG